MRQAIRDFPSLFRRPAPLPRRPRQWIGASTCLLLATLVTSGLLINPSPARAQTGVSVGKSGLPLPRFVSLKAERVNVRIGPGQDYRIAWIFIRPGLPLEVIQEFDTWRRVRDSDGSVGWIFHSLLSGNRTGVVTPWREGQPTPVFARPGSGAWVTAYLEPKVVGEIERCQDAWCRIYGEGYRGWIRQDQLWGVYPNETID